MRLDTAKDGNAKRKSESRRAAILYRLVREEMRVAK